MKWMSATPSLKDIKILWGRCGNCCAMCRTPLVEERQDGTPFVVGEAAHIRGESKGSPRYDITMTDRQRGSCGNLILLCPTDHTKIDKNEADYPVDKLNDIKRDHEKWVRDIYQSNIPIITFAELDIALKYLSSADVSGIEDLALTPPREKIKKNQLSNDVGRLISMGVSQGGLVKDFFNRNPDMNFAQRMKTHFIEKYQALKGKGLDGDSIFYSLLNFAFGNNGDFKIKTAGLCLVAYFFEQCDIFEK